MNTDVLQNILKELEKCSYKVSTDTRKDLSGTVYFALKGESFDGNQFVNEALEKGAIASVTDNPANLQNKTTENIFLVDDVQKTLQEVAKAYRKLFTIPIVVIGGSNGKTTSKELLRDVLRTKFKVHSTQGSFNNHFGVPLSVLSMDKETEIGVFEIGANHPKEHMELLNIICPTHVVVTNNGMDHLEGFGSPEGARMANKEIYDWALEHKAEVFVNQKNTDLMQDSKDNIRSLYSVQNIESTNATPLHVLWNNETYKTHMAGNYNIENIELALSIGQYFNVDDKKAIGAICEYTPASKRSEFMTKNNINFIVDCYNANPTSMKLALESFLESDTHPRGIILGDMLELGEYSDVEHKKIADFIATQKFDSVIYIGERFKKALQNTDQNYQWFENSDIARAWFVEQKFDNYTFLLKGSRGIKVEKVLEF